jgi:putative transcriptional regulator
MQKNLEEDIIIELVKHFKMLRQKQGLSHNKLALKAGITRSAISQIESGKRTPTLIVGLKLAHALGQNLGAIIAACERKIYKS